LFNGFFRELKQQYKPSMVDKAKKEHDATYTHLKDKKK